MSCDNRLMGRAVYISGPVTGIDGYVDAFYAAARVCAASGARWTCNPCDLVAADESRPLAMAKCVAELAKTRLDHGVERPFYDVVLTLPGSRKSRGARLECEIANALGIEIIELRNGDRDDTFERVIDDAIALGATTAGTMSRDSLLKRAYELCEGRR